MKRFILSTPFNILLLVFSTIIIYISGIEIIAIQAAYKTCKQLGAISPQ
jgi:hypothetical protein